MDILRNIHREITSLSANDCFLVLDREQRVFDYPVHFHPELELNFIMNGEGVRRIVGDSIENVGNLELILVGSNLYHGWELHECTNKNVHEVTIQFHNNLFDKTFLERNFMKPISDMFYRSAHGILFSKEAIRSVSPRLLRVSKLDGMDYFIDLMSILHDLAISRNQRLLSTSTVHLENFDNSEKLKVMYDFVQENYVSKITLEEISNLLNMSSVSFNRFVKHRTGKTFVEYLNDVRIGHAAAWLIEKDSSIAEIAFMCGFRSIANFNRVFKKSKNRTPSQFRRDFSGIKRVL